LLTKGSSKVLISRKSSLVKDPFKPSVELKLHYLFSHPRENFRNNNFRMFAKIAYKNIRKRTHFCRQDLAKMFVFAKNLRNGEKEFSFQPYSRVSVYLYFDGIATTEYTEWQRSLSGVHSVQGDPDLEVFQ